MDNRLLYSTKTDGKFTRGQIATFILGTAAGIIMLTRGKILYGFFGLCIIAAEIYLVFRDRRDKRSYIEIYEDKVSGMGFENKDDKFPTEFEFSYNELTDVIAYDGNVTVIVGDKSYKCYALGKEMDIFKIIGEKMEKGENE